MTKIDFRKANKALYAPPKDEFVEIAVPAMRFVKIDGAGRPAGPAYSQAIEWLYSVSYPMKFAAKAALGLDYVVPPLEGLWWADDPTAFTADRRDEWLWTMMIMAPDAVTHGLFADAVVRAERKLGAPPKSLRLESYAEGFCLQALHVGSYADEGPLLARLHDEIMPERGLTFNGHHHEIYLSDARRVAPEKLRTVLRQPVRPI